MFVRVRKKAINLFKVHDSAGPVAVVVDLPGYGYAKLPKALQTDIGVQVRIEPLPPTCHKEILFCGMPSCPRHCRQTSACR
jgi:hypothetical protein